MLYFEYQNNLVFKLFEHQIEFLCYKGRRHKSSKETGESRKGMDKMIGKICGIGSYVPRKILDNDDLSKFVETNDQWIRERTGVARRHIIEDETTVTMAVEAANRALKDAGVNAIDIDLLIVTTASSNVILPCTACEVQKRIKADHATCFDLNAACTGFLFAYNTAQAYIQTNMYKTVLIVGAETLSELLDWTDRGTCILFGDGAGAVVVRAKEDGFYYGVTHSQGEKGQALTCESRHQKGFGKTILERDTLMQMDGQAVFTFAVRNVPKVIKEALDKGNFHPEEIDYYILHQANQRIVEAVAKRLQIDMEKFPMNLQEYGNTSSASIPILLDECKKKGLLREGQKIVMAGFGAGLSWGASVLEW